MIVGYLPVRLDRMNGPLDYQIGTSFKLFGRKGRYLCIGSDRREHERQDDQEGLVAKSPIQNPPPSG
jgi:hypothetical protein